MSGKPSPDSVRVLLDILKENTRLTAKVKALKEAETELRLTEHALANNFRVLDAQLESMDVTRPGNTGFQDRQNWLLNEMYRQLMERR